MRKVSLHFLLMMGMCALIFSACKKSSSTPPKTATKAISYWSGTITQMSDLNIETVTNAGLYSNGVLVIYPGIIGVSDTAASSDKFPGTYTLTGTNFSGSYVDVDATHGTVTWTGTVSSSVNPNTLSGTFTGTGNGGTYHGTFSLTKQ